MKEIINYTKIEPNERVKKINKALNLFFDSSKEINNAQKKSSKEKSEYYGIILSRRFFNGYYIRQTKLIGGNNKNIHPKDRIFPILVKSEFTKWLLLYEKINYNDADNLYKYLLKASKGYTLNLNEPKWVEISTDSKVDIWIDNANYYFGQGKNKYSFVIFLIGRNIDIYSKLKEHSLYNNGYVSQVVKVMSLKKKYYF